MPKVTDLQMVKDISKCLFDAVPINFNDFIIQHPYISSAFTTYNGKLINLSDKNVFLETRQNIFNIIDKYDLYANYYLVNSPWKLTWLKYTKDYISNSEFSELLADAWVTQENPNDDKNVSRRTAISWFKHADKKKLMTEEDFKIYKSLPDKIKVYRGVSVGRVELGLSWTANKQKAQWFQHRFDEAHGTKKGYLLEALVDKKDILAYFNTRGEDELVVNVYAIRNSIKVVGGN